MSTKANNGHSALHSPDAFRFASIQSRQRDLKSCIAIPQDIERHEAGLSCTMTVNFS